MKKYLIFYLFAILLIFNALMLTLSLVFYSGQFDFAYYPYSYLGATRAFDFSSQLFEGERNLTSQTIYSIEMLISGLITLYISWQYHHLYRNDKQYKEWIAFAAGVGFIISGLSPDDTRHILHVIGSALIVSSFWVLTTYYLFELKDRIPAFQFYLLQFVLQIPILTYALFYFLDNDLYSSVLQKVSFLCVSLVLLFSLYKLSKFSRV